MATYCKTCLGELCDHCDWYDFNGDEHGCYTEEGFCRRWNQPRDPLDGCNEYHCRYAKRTGEAYSTIQYKVRKPPDKAP